MIIYKEKTLLLISICIVVVGLTISCQRSISIDNQISFNKSEGNNSIRVNISNKVNESINYYNISSINMSNIKVNNFSFNNKSNINISSFNKSSSFNISPINNISIINDSKIIKKSNMQIKSSGGHSSSKRREIIKQPPIPSIIVSNVNISL